MTKKQKRELKRIIVAAVIFFVFMIGENIGLFPFMENSLIRFIIFLIPYYIVGRDVVLGALHGIKERDIFDEEFLMTVATIGAFAVGEYPEAAAVMLFYSVGEWFQSYAVGKSRRSIKELMDIAPEYANLLGEDGLTREVDPSEVKVGDIIMIKPGEKVPVDGEVIDGKSMMDTKAITGESVPRSTKPGDMIISGCINGEGLLKVKVLKKYEDSTVAKILDLVENASSKKSRTEKFITRFARVYTPIVVIGAVILAFVPPVLIYFGVAEGVLPESAAAGGLLEWIRRACTFLVISCPCALVISVPLSFFGGIGAASKAGVLVKGSNYLETLGELKMLVSDKTGTLTKGEFKVSSVMPEENRDEILRLAAYGESFSNHPIAGSVKSAYNKPVDEKLIESSENISGHGIRAVVSGKEILCGNDKLMRENKIEFTPCDNAGTVIYVAEDGKFKGTIIISDAIKEEAKEAVSAMKSAGVRDIIMLTGDRKNVGESVAAELGLTRAYTELLPGDKVGIVEELEGKLNAKEKLGFVGDGINDAPVLARADIGIAMGSMGSDAAIEAADVVIMDDNLMRIPQVIRIARKTLSIAKQNIVFAIGVKIVVLILGALGIANMWAAVFADTGVSFICVLNSMRSLKSK